MNGLFKADAKEYLKNGNKLFLKYHHSIYQPCPLSSSKQKNNIFVCKIIVEQKNNKC
jgi:hypothetical protein